MLWERRVAFRKLRGPATRLLRRARHLRKYYGQTTLQLNISMGNAARVMSCGKPSLTFFAQSSASWRLKAASAPP